MTATTPVYGIPYPTATTKAKDLPAELAAMGAGVEAALLAASIPPATPAAVRVAASAAARDAYWGVPSTEAQRIALQNRGATTIRTDKAWEERYYATYNAATNPGGASTPGWYPKAASATRGRVGAFSSSSTAADLDFDYAARARGDAFEYAAPWFKCRLPGSVQISASVAFQNPATGWVNVALQRLRAGVTTRSRMAYGVINAPPGGWFTTSLDTVLDVLPGDQFSIRYWSLSAVNGVLPSADAAELVTYLDLTYL